MSDLNPPSSLPDDQVARALSRVHGRLRRRTNRLRGAGAAALACLALLGTGVATQDSGSDAEAPMGMVDPDGSHPAPRSGAICGRAPAVAEAFGLELRIEGPVEWLMSPIHSGRAPWVTVVARNVGRGSLTISVPARVVGLTDRSLVDTEVSAPVSMPTTTTLGPSESVELRALLPTRSCAGEALGVGRFRFMPIVAVQLGDSHRVVAGGSSSLTVRLR